MGRFTFPVTVINDSNVNCTSGNFNLKNAAGQSIGVYFGRIPAHSQDMRNANMDSPPTFAAWYFAAEGGGAWGPNFAQDPAGWEYVILHLT